jgi:hypothetical protein
VKNRFQSLPFKFNLQRYIMDAASDMGVIQNKGAWYSYGEVGLCTLNQVDP